MGEALVKSSKRKKNWYIERKGDEKKIITVLGEVSYRRTYFVSKKKKMNQIKHEVLAETKKQIDILYVETDEDHIHLQNGCGAMPRLAYVHEGIKSLGKRNELINPYYIGGLHGKPEVFWEEVYEHIKNNYNVDSIKRIYLSGDGAAWIKTGLDYLPKSKFVLDKYHMNKYILKATTHAKEYRARVWWSLNTAHKEAFVKYMNKLKGVAETEAKIKEIEECECYILNHWEGIEIKATEDVGVLGCRAESHVSHILSDRMSSRSLGRYRSNE